MEKFMNYSTDRPIETGEQDLLGRASFSEQLGKAIYGVFIRKIIRNIFRKMKYII